MKLLIIDGQGGGIGRQLIEALRAGGKAEMTIWAVGTNAMATANMLRAGAQEGATGENPVCVLAPRADVILGPAGILLCDAMLGEVTERMVLAIGRSPARKILIPLSRCGMEIAGLQTPTLGEAIGDAVRRVLAL